MLAYAPADELMPSVSPDGRWMAYTSTETGQTEVYVVSISLAFTPRLEVTRREDLFAFPNRPARTRIVTTM